MRNNLTLNVGFFVSDIHAAEYEFGGTLGILEEENTSELLNHR